MEQVIEKEAIYIILPKIEEKAEKVEEKPKEIKKKFKFRKHAKQHQERININKIRNNMDASRYRASLYNQ